MNGEFDKDAIFFKYENYLFIIEIRNNIRVVSLLVCINKNFMLAVIDIMVSNVYRFTLNMEYEELVQKNSLLKIFFFIFSIYKYLLVRICVCLLVHICYFKMNKY